MHSIKVLLYIIIYHKANFYLLYSLYLYSHSTIHRNRYKYFTLKSVCADSLKKWRKGILNINHHKIWKILYILIINIFKVSLCDFLRSWVFWVLIKECNSNIEKRFPKISKIDNWWKLFRNLFLICTYMLNLHRINIIK